MSDKQPVPDKPTTIVPNTLGPVIQHYRNNFVSSDHKPVETRIDGKQVKHIGSRSRTSGKHANHRLLSEFSNFQAGSDKKRTYELISNCGSDKGEVYYKCEVDRIDKGDPTNPLIVFTKLKGHTDLYERWCRKIRRIEDAITYQIYHGADATRRNLKRRKSYDFGIRTEIDWRNQKTDVNKL